MSELVPAMPAEIPNVVTGELVSTSDIPAMAMYLRDIRTHEAKLRDLKRGIEGVILAYARSQGTKTLHLGPVDAKVSGGSVIEWDVEKLQELLDAGLPYERFNELVTIEQTTKVNTAVANSIAASNPAYRVIVEAARTDKPAPERVVVSG